MKGHFFHFVVLGDSLAGLAVAVMLARKGMDIAVLVSPNTGYQEAFGRSLDPAPRSLMGLDKGNWLEKFCARSAIIQKPAREDELGAQILFADARIDLHSPVSEMLAEIRDEIPTFYDTLAGVYRVGKTFHRKLESLLNERDLVQKRGLAKHLLWEHQTLRDLKDIKQNEAEAKTSALWMLESKRLTQYVLGHYLLFSNSLGNIQNAFSVAWNLLAPRVDPFPELDSLTQLRQELLRRLEETMAKIIVLEGPPTFSVKSKRLISVGLAGGQTMVGENFILGAVGSFTRPLFSKESSARIIPPVVQKLSYCLELRKSEIPEGMGKNLVFFESDETRFPIQMQRLPYQGIAKSQTLEFCYLSAYLPLTEKDGDDNQTPGTIFHSPAVSLKTYLETGFEAFSSLQKIFPFLGESIHYSFPHLLPEHRDKNEGDPLVAAYLNAQLASPYNRYSLPKGSTYFHLKCDSIYTRIKNLFFLGPSNFPALGLSGEMLAALKFVEQLEKNK